jgi:hypothetical protein
LDSTVELIREVFHPEPYEVLEEPLEGTLLHLSRAGAGCRYVLLVAPVDDRPELRAFLRDLKAELRRHHRASIGVIVVLLGAYADWKAPAALVRPDRHGLRRVILQGLLFLDPEKRIYRLSQSRWGPIRFGNFQGQMDRVHYLLGELGAEEAGL